MKKPITTTNHGEVNKQVVEILTRMFIGVLIPINKHKNCDSEHLNLYLNKRLVCERKE